MSDAVEAVAVRNAMDVLNVAGRVRTASTGIGVAKSAILVVARYEAIESNVVAGDIDSANKGNLTGVRSKCYPGSIGARTRSGKAAVVACTQVDRITAVRLARRGRQ